MSLMSLPRRSISLRNAVAHFVTYFWAPTPCRTPPRMFHSLAHS
jgi:hypothetical protein